MTKTIKYAISILLLLGTAWEAVARDYLFRDGKTNYTIVVSNNASESEKTAARELKTYLKQIGGAEFTISEKSGYRNIFVGYCDGHKKFAKIKAFSDDDESFTYRKSGHDLLIYGGRNRGTMYGVFSFLEEQLGVRWYTADCTVVPKQTSFRLCKLNHTEHPAIKFRRTDYYYLRFAKNGSTWSAHNKENQWTRFLQTKYGNLEGYYGVETMPQLMPSSKYFKEHPEYYAYNKGKRIPNGQLCLSNPEVLRICKEAFLKMIADNPGCQIYDISQNDGAHLYCECEECKKIESQYGGHSGLMLWFVNQVAREVKKTYPDVLVATMAYLYTRQAPKNIVPDDNVVIRMGVPEACFAHPIEAECFVYSYAMDGKDILKDLKDWEKIAPRLYIWDYMVDYKLPTIPYPNFSILAQNIRTYRDHHVEGIFAQACGRSRGGEFEELKNWVLMKLMWNPDQDVNSLVKDFVYGYYGTSAAKVFEYYKMCQDLVTPDTHFNHNMLADNPLFTNSFIDKSFEILNQAEDVADNAEIRERVYKVKMQPLSLKCYRNPKASMKDGSWKELRELFLKYEVEIGGVKAPQYIEQFEKKYK